MTTILPSARTPFDVIGADVGQALQSVLPGALQQRFNRENLQQSLSQIKNIAGNPNASPLDITLAVMQAGAGIPGSERYLGQLIPLLQQMTAAKASQNLPLAGETAATAGQAITPRDRSKIEPMAQRQQLPDFVDALKRQTEQSFPTNIGPQGGPGQAPQAATAGKKVPILSPQELIPQAKKLAAERTAGGIPTTAKEALEELKQNEEQKKIYNDEVDKELAQRVESQKTYGEKAVTYLKEVDPKASSEIQAIFQKKGEELAKRGDSEADINRALAKEAERYRNAIANVESDLSAPRLYHKITRGLNGTYKDFNESAEDLRRHLNPLIELGLFNKARAMLQEKGFGPEEREMILHPLSDQSLSIIRQLPNLQPQVRIGTRGKAGISAPAVDVNAIKETIKNIQQTDPNFSPLLVRKAMEDLNYDWRSFKNAWNEAVKEGMPITGDQKDMEGYLDTPPVGLLDKFLSGLNLIGR